MPVNSQAQTRSGRTLRARVPLALIALAAILPGIADADTPGPNQVAQLLATAKAQALQLRSDFSTLDFVTGSEASWHSHAAIINLYKEHINAVQQQSAKLDAARSAASSGQKTAIERVAALLRELAAHAESVIDRINNNAQRLDTGEYKDYLRLSIDLTSQLAALIADSVDYDRTRQQLERLAKEPEPAPPSQKF